MPTPPRDIELALMLLEHAHILLTPAGAAIITEHIRTRWPTDPHPSIDAHTSSWRWREPEHLTSMRLFLQQQDSRYTWPG
jgi:hypothetical protein